MRKKVYVKINNVSDITTFAMLAGQLEGDIDVTKGKYCVDGASLMGLFGINMSNGVAVEYPESATEFENFLRPFIVEELD